MQPKLNIRCQYSQLGLNTMSNVKIKQRNEPKKGTIVRETMDKRCWIIVWDGNETVSSGHHKKYIDVIKDEEFINQSIMNKLRVGNKQNSFLNGEWAGHVRKWGKKFTSGIRRAMSKKIIRKDLEDSGK